MEKIIIGIFITIVIVVLIFGIVGLGAIVLRKDK